MEIAVATAFSHHTPIEFIAGTAARIEAAGFAAMWVPEHVLFFPDYASRYPYSPDGRMPGDPDGILDPFTALTFVAAHTSTIRLGTGVCLVPQRQPVYTAKMVADVDYLSGGRLDFGIGIGWLEEEFVALGMDFAARAARCDEYIAAMQALWGVDPVTFGGETVTISDAQFNPKPVQRPHPPIYVGGESVPAMRRVARYGNGWYGYGVQPDQIDGLYARLDEHLEAAGRRREELKIAIGRDRPRIDPETVAAYAEAGVDQLVLPIFARDLDGLDRRIEGLREMTGTA